MVLVVVAAVEQGREPCGCLRLLLREHVGVHLRRERLGRVAEPAGHDV